MFSRLEQRNVLISVVLGAAAGSVGCSSTSADCENSRSCGVPTVGAQAGSAGQPSANGEPSAGAGGSPEPAAAGGAESGAAGSSGEGGEGDGGAAAALDTTGPKVVSITPENRSKGVEEDAVITVTFDEPMNEASVEDAFLSADLAGQLTYAWNEEGTVLTVTPLSPLEYAVGDDYVEAREYTAAIATTAVDLAGNSLQVEASTTFSTLRRSQRTLPLEHVYEVWTEGDMLLDVLSAGSCLSYVGSSGDAHLRAFVRFDLSEVPGGIHEVESAELSVYLMDSDLVLPDQDPYDALGPLGVTHYYEASYSVSSVLAPGLAELGPIADSIDDTGWRSLDVTAAVSDDLANLAAREESSSYRFGYPAVPNPSATDTILISCDELPTLELVYTRP